MNAPVTVAADLIGEIRGLSGLRPAELARRAGLPRSVVSAYERGHRQPGVDALARLASAADMELRVVPVHRSVDPVKAGRTLAQVLDLAEALPSRSAREQDPSCVEAIEKGSLSGTPT